MSSKQTFPLPEKPQGFNGMVISLPGVLVRAAECCEVSRDMSHLGHMLRTLRNHIEQLRESPNDVEAIRRLVGFLNLWVD